MKKLCVIPILMLLAGCSVPRSGIRTIVLNQCPPLVDYSKDQQKLAAEELKKIYTDSQIANMIVDYSKLREACRIVNKRVQVKVKLKYRNGKK